MGGFGAISGMVNSIKENSRLLSSKKSMRDRKDDYAGFEKNSKPLRFTDNMTKEEHEDFRNRLTRRQKRSNITISIILMLFTISIIAWVMYLNF